MKSTIILFLTLLSSFCTLGQKFNLRSGVGMSGVFWHENQATANFSIQLSYQKKTSPIRFYGELKTFGNAFDSKVDPSKYEFIPHNSPSSQYPNTLDINNLSSYYRGGAGEAGVQFHVKKEAKKSYIFPEISLYSISFARKISSEKTQYVEEEKYALHGVSGGAGIQFPGKVKVSLKTKLFVPLFTNFTLYGRYVGVPYETSKQEIDVCYRNAAEFTYKKFNLVVEYDSYHLGKSENLKSKTITDSYNNIFSVFLNYLF